MVRFIMFSLNNGLETCEVHLFVLSFDQTCQCWSHQLLWLDKTLTLSLDENNLRKF